MAYTAYVYVSPAAKFDHSKAVDKICSDIQSSLEDSDEDIQFILDPGIPFVIPEETPEQISFLAEERTTFRAHSACYVNALETWDAFLNSEKNVGKSDLEFQRLDNELIDSAAFLETQVTRELVEKLISECPAHPHDSEPGRHRDAAIKLLDAVDNFRPMCAEDLTYSISNASHALLALVLRAQVEINYAIHFNIDPTIGWIRTEHCSPESYVVSNPFFNARFDLAHSGALRACHYLPRKQLLVTSHADTASFSKQKKNVEPLTMRKSKDSYACKFIEKASDESSELHKVYYFKSGLGGFARDSTTGMSLDYWIEGKHANNIELHSHFQFRSKPELLKLRTLGSAGGISEHAHSFDDSQSITFTADVTEGGLEGIRLIDSVEQLVIDLRNSKALSSVSIEMVDSSSSIYTDCHIILGVCPHSIAGFDRVSSLHMTIF